MRPSAEIITEIPFHDVDMMQIVWHGNYYKYFELARTALFREHNGDIDALRGMGVVLPIIESQCRYIHAIRYGDRIRVHAELLECEFRIKIQYTIFAADGGKRLAKGHTVQVALESGSNKLRMLIPDQVSALFGGKQC